ncbi:MAG: hypothetical protein JWO13_2553 [Acidobacteriales bacterium]|nr:hypothetical protein [Terriglobales bacterium]
MKLFQLCFALCVIFSIVGCTNDLRPAAPQVDIAAEEAAIRAADAQWLAAAKARDTEKAVPFWTDDATIAMPGAPLVSGKQAIKEYVASSFASPDFSISWTTDKVVVSPAGDTAYSTGVDQITFKGPDGKAMTVKNNGVAIWRKQSDGAWKVAYDIATPEPAPIASSSVGSGKK